MLATIASATLLGARGRPVTVEVHVSQGLPGFTVVGLPDESCREARDRVRAALLSSGATWPAQRITVNLAPSGVRKGGAGLDLPIALGVLVASGVVPPAAVEGLACVGELGLDGTVRRVPGLVPLAAAALALVLVVPSDGAHEAALVAPGAVRGVPTLRSLLEALTAEAPWPRVDDPPPVGPSPPLPDLADVRGQAMARLALEVVAAGGHHLLLSGPPGSGKSLLAHRLPGLLPPLDPATALEVTMIHSAAGIALPSGGLVDNPPFRAPHHTASLVSMVGGGTAAMRPGEASAAHGGVLFLDELAEFDPRVLDGLREPLEEGVVRVARARAAAEFPARFVLVGAMNPCACGMAGRPGACRCSTAQLARHARRLSGPLLDRFDLRLGVQRPAVDELLGPPTGEPTSVARARVETARDRAGARGPWRTAQLPGHLLDQLAPLTDAARAVLRRELEAGRLTGRGLHRVRRVARTLADLQPVANDVVDDEMVNLALLLRVDPLDTLRREVA